MMDYSEIIKKYGLPGAIPNKPRSEIFFIAEAGTGHQGDLDVVMEMVDTCVSHGVAAIKFQHVIAEEILHPYCGKVQFTSGDIDLFNYFKQSEAKADHAFWKKVLCRCKEKKILFLCSFFGSRSFQDLQSLEVEAYKIASPEMNYYRLWQKLLSVVEPVFFSSGLARREDLEHLFGYLDKHRFSRERLIHLHCITQYPASPEDYDLRFTEWFEKTFGVLTGLSDHSHDPYWLPAIFTAVRAMKGLPVVIEKHFTLEKLAYNIDDPVAIDEYQLGELMECLTCTYKHFSKLSTELGSDPDIPLSSLLTKGFQDGFQSSWKNSRLDDTRKGWRSIFDRDRRNLETILGGGSRELSDSERIDYPTTKRSLLAIRDIEEGEVISSKNTAYLRSEKNLRPGLDYHWEEKVMDDLSSFKADKALKAKRMIGNGSPISEDDLF